MPPTERRRRGLRYPYQGFRSHQDYLEAVWHERLGELRAFERRFGHARVPQRWHENRPLERWVRHQRDLHRQGELRRDRKQALLKVGFEFELPNAPVSCPWEERYRELAAFQKRSGHCRVPRRWPGNTALANWVHTQRAAYSRRTLKPKRIADLRALGFDWSVRELLPWQTQYDRLREFRREHGHSDVSSRHDDERLANWVARQRMLFHEGRLPAQRRRKLERLGFHFRLLGVRRSFEERLAQLRRIRQENGQQSVSQYARIDRSLEIWIGNIRRSHRNGRLDARQIEELEKLGVHLNAREARWERMFERLLAFQKRFGHVRVKVGWKRDPVLARWVVKQRSNFRGGNLPHARQQRLKKLGFFEHPSLLRRPGR